jgi:methylmalonyl-CoA/ethylmalonyl-CoA epimerase
MRKIEHIGIAVSDLAISNTLFSKLLGKDHYKIETVESEGVNTSFFIVGDTKIELVESSRYDSAIAKFIDKKGQGMHHMAFHVDDIKQELKRLSKEGFKQIGEVKKGADNKLICFLHPKTTNGVLIELCQEKE